MSETTDLVVIEKANAMTVFKSTDQIEDILQKVEREVMSFVPDVTTAKGRKEIASLAYKVAQTKTYLDGLGKDLVAELKEIPKLIDANRKTVRDRLDELKEKARQPLTDYEVEQERIKQEEEAKRAAEELAKKIESDHEMALLMNDAFDRELAEKKAEQERQRIAHEEEIKRQAEERAKREAEEKAAAEIAAAKKREEDAIAAKAQAELLAKQEKEKAEREAKEALERAEREKQAAIEAEQRKAREAEATRMAEEKRIKDEAAARAADVAHRKVVNNKALADLVAVGLTEEQARTAITAIAKGEVTAIRITY
ncbi:cell envelope biogenesis protein TolA [Cronobacter sakazakii]|uniref:cell envelope biogenesis protein TolA n=1 Tax=Cronobacter sakazakii TaxID=28141 RepID=UPI00084E2CF1|nr:cell envelope biogenesis protein TolA [Cronobacter sakazakii]PUW50091.1 cell envelope biogenesis protein TolA [Cronobacter sakazakii]PUW56672.1 cell envelope biogenesis protein TolA [Cronobacter sakazakii]PUW69848.1 cell envelope biogenesis protein TolA [Cronobacter sakazakii]PUW71981.1 cell envelope biogenesis protein TolA [Cronobacter sakazakii]PUW72616.1 cell envelope biogenesis protein TolA [Cronobacter sakazakii]